MSKRPSLPNEEQNLDWESEGGRTLADPTLVAIGEPVTAPHDLAPVAAGLELELAKARDAGYDAGFRDGTERKARVVWDEAHEDATAAFKRVFLLNGLTDDEIKNVVAEARKGFTPV